MHASAYVTFTPLRSIGIKDTLYIKPDNMFRHIPEIKAADVLLFPRQWQVNGLVHALGKAIFPSQATYYLGQDKVEMTRGLMAACPQMVPRTEICPKHGVDFYRLADTLGLPFVCKEPKASCGLGVYKIESEADFRYYEGRTQVIYAQELLDIDRDLRVVVVGDQVIAAYWRVGDGTGFHNNLARGGHVVRENIPEFAVQKTLDLARQLGIDYAGFDLAVTPEGIYILEFNPWFGTGGLPFGMTDLGKRIEAWLVRQRPSRPGRISA